MSANNRIAETYDEINKVSIIGTKAEESRNPANTHYVFIADEHGISIVFTELKSKLADNPTGFQTLIYSTNQKEKIPLFKAELSSLEKRFSHQLEVHYISNGATTSLSKTILQETLEVVINTNLNNNLLFNVFGNEKLVELVMEHLCFLGINQNQIVTQKFNN
jgi:hypothetical protein